MDAQVIELAEQPDRDPEARLPILQTLQARRGGLSQAAIPIKSALEHFAPAFQQEVAYA